jgi:hypothetical protein
MEPTDYAGNSKKDKEKAAKEDPKKPPKEVKKIVSEPTTMKKKGIGRKFKDMVVEADFKSVFRYIVEDIMIPGAKAILVNSVANGAERMVYGDRRRGTSSSGQGSRISYSGISKTMLGGSPLRNAPSIERGPRSGRRTQDDVIIPSRKEAEEILELMIDIIDNYEQVSVADYNEMVDQPYNPHTDQKWGWTYLGDVQILQVRGGGYIIDLPPAEPLP